VSSVNPAPSPEGGLQLQELEAHVFLGPDEKLEGWYMDTGATSHMTRRVEAFSKLSCKLQGIMRFGDGSLVPTQVRDIMTFTGKTREKIKLVGVLFFPCLKNNIISLRQLDENSYKVPIEKGVLRI
jgi:hypothetical protein